MSNEGNIEAIEERLHDHERELSRTLETIRDRMTSRELVGELYDRARARGYPQALGRAVRDNPLPTVIAAICGAWLAKSARDAIVSERAKRSERSVEPREGPALSEVALADTAAGGRAGEERPAETGAEETEAARAARVVLPPGTRPGA
jgi:hypothetical protein